jgi:hypothetical protein
VGDDEQALGVVKQFKAHDNKQVRLAVATFLLKYVHVRHDTRHTTHDTTHDTRHDTTRRTRTRTRVRDTVLMVAACTSYVKASACDKEGSAEEPQHTLATITSVRNATQRTQRTARTATADVRVGT